MTPVHIEHEFRTADIALFWRSYFDPQHRVRLDGVTGIAGRQVLERVEDEETLRLVQQIVPVREVPAFVRKLTGAGLETIESSVFHKRDDRIDIDIQPAMFPSRTHIKMVYVVRQVAPGVLLRTCDGEIEINVPLVGGRIERGIRDDLIKSYDLGVPLTQEYLDRHAV